MAGWRFSYWRPYVPVARRRAQAARMVASLTKKGRKVEPVEIEGRTIARTFWGEAWCENLERYSDFENRLPRGRRYVRNGSVIDLQIAAGRVEALVSGSEIYKVRVDFEKVVRKRWEAIKDACSGKIDSVVELLQGKLSGGVMEVLTARESGLFPAPGEIDMDCSCPDWADMCKHVAAVLYGVGARLDTRPELLFLLRGVDHAELISEAAGTALARTERGAAALAADEMEQIFGIELDRSAPAAAARRRQGPASRRTKSAGRTAAATSPRAGAPPARLPAAEVPAAKAPAAGLPAARVPAVKLSAVKVPSVKVRAAKRGPDPASDSLDARRKRLQEFFLCEDTLTSSGYRDLFSLPPAAATRELERLTGRMYLIRSGAKRGTRYFAGTMLW